MFFLLISFDFQNFSVGFGKFWKKKSLCLVLSWIENKYQIHIWKQSVGNFCYPVCLQDVKELFVGSEEKQGGPKGMELQAIEVHPVGCLRQGSSASSDTYASCFTHPQSSPSQCDMTPDSFRNVYVNPLDPDNEGGGGGQSPAAQASPPLYEEIFQGDIVPAGSSPHSAHAFFPPGSPAHGASAAAAAKGPNQIVQILDDGITATWKKQPSPKAAGGKPRPGSRDNTTASALRKMFKNKKQKTPPFPLSKPRARFHTDAASTDSARSQSSSESVNSQGSAVAAIGGGVSGSGGGGRSAPTVPGRFRKKPFARHSSSPNTGKKLANYHLIANSQSGKKNLPSTLCWYKTERVVTLLFRTLCKSRSILEKKNEHHAKTDSKEATKFRSKSERLQFCGMLFTRKDVQLSKTKPLDLSPVQCPYCTPALTADGIGTQAIGFLRFDLRGLWEAGVGKTKTAPPISPEWVKFPPGTGDFLQFCVTNVTQEGKTTHPSLQCSPW